MSAATPAFNDRATAGAPGGALRAGLSTALRGPAEGWLTALCLVAMIAALAWSIDDAAWIRGQGELTDSLTTFGVLGLIFGTLGAKAGLGRWRTHLLGAVAVALVVPLVAGGVLLGERAADAGIAGLAVRYRAVAEACYQAWHDLAILLRPLTREYGHYMVVLGALVWATGQHAAYAVFGHRRPLDAVIVTGGVLLANMALTYRDQLHLLVLASLAGLLLLARTHAFEERTAWVHRRIGDPAAVASLYLRGGTSFVLAATIGALLLTASASSAPLQGLWSDLPQRLADLSQDLSKFLPFGGASRNPGIVAFGPKASISGVWEQGSGTAFTAQLPAGEQERFLWRVETFARFDVDGWAWIDPIETRIEADGALFRGAADDPSFLGERRDVIVTVRPESFRGRFVVSPQAVAAVDASVIVRLEHPGGWFTSVEFTGPPPDDYRVTALVPVLDDVPGGLTENRLRIAGTDYPPAVTALYLDVPDGVIGPAASALLDEVRSRVDGSTPYDLAKAMRDYLRNGPFEYRTNVTDLDCAGVSTVECFARFRQGYCQYYATTMAILLREAGIPTRLVQGFLPGERSTSGVETVLNASAHAWVEVYFPGYGWVEFDPTGGNLSPGNVLQSGRPIAVTPSPRPSIGQPVTDAPGQEGDPSRRPGATGGGVTTPRDPGAGPFIVIGILLGGSMIALAVLAWRRGPRRPMHPDTAWQMVSRLAARLGFAARPSETVFEYAGALGGELPAVRPELETVARAKVEVAYGQRALGEDRLRGVALAHRRLRLGLLRLVLRRIRGGRRR